MGAGLSGAAAPGGGGPYERLASNLEALGLTAASAVAGEYMAMAADGRKTFAEALLEMTEAELRLRDDADFRRKAGKANFPYVKTLADFDFPSRPSIARGVAGGLATLRFVECAENVLLVGSPGVGKTHIAVALGAGAVRARKPACFIGRGELVDDLKRADEKGQLERRLRFYGHLSLPVVDEVGRLGVDKAGADLVSRLVSRRHGRRSTIVTTNVGVARWGEVFGDPAAAAAIADRLCHHCTVIRATGRSHGTKDMPAEPGGRDRRAPSVPHRGRQQARVLREQEGPHHQLVDPVGQRLARGLLEVAAEPRPAEGVPRRVDGARERLDRARRPDLLGPLHAAPLSRRLRGKATTRARRARGAPSAGGAPMCRKRHMCAVACGTFALVWMAYVDWRNWHNLDLR